MDCWHLPFERAHERNTVRRWAELEGRSATMRDELYQQYAQRSRKRRNLLTAGYASVEFAVVLLDVWFRVRSG